MAMSSCVNAENSLNALGSNSQIFRYIWTARRPSGAGQANESQQVVKTEAVSASRWDLGRVPPSFRPASR